LLVGCDPQAVDYSDPALPLGMNAERIRDGISLALKQVTDRAWRGDLYLIRPDEVAVQTVERQLASANFNQHAAAGQRGSCCRWLPLSPASPRWAGLMQ